MFDDKVFSIEKRMFETVLGLHDMYSKQNKMVYKQLLSSLERNFLIYMKKCGILNRTYKRMYNV